MKIPIPLSWDYKSMAASQSSVKPDRRYGLVQKSLSFSLLPTHHDVAFVSLSNIISRSSTTFLLSCFVSFVKYLKLSYIFMQRKAKEWIFKWSKTQEKEQIWKDGDLMLLSNYSPETEWPCAISWEMLPYQPFCLLALNTSHILICATSQISKVDEIAVTCMFIFSGVNWVDPRQGEVNCRTSGLHFELCQPPLAGETDHQETKVYIEAPTIALI